jgi:hypothetical protein
LQEIGREVGISSESISLAAQSLDQPATSTETKLFGFPIGVGRTVEFNRPLTDSDWEGLVADLRTTFRARGKLRIDGPFRQWTNGNLRALLEPTPTGHRLRLETEKGDARPMMNGGLLIAGGFVAMTLALAVTGGLANPGVATRVTFMALMGLGMFAFGALRLPGWARLRRAQIEQVIARLVNSSGKPERAALSRGKIPDLA